MVVTNFKCDNTKCGQIFEIFKNTVTEDFPSSCKCPFCGGLESHRMWGIADFSVSGGMLGNSLNGYDSNVTYHPSNYGRFKGKKIRSIK